ncbi:hypothetical protein D3C74_408400 [compost metagenome]
MNWNFLSGVDKHRKAMRKDVVEWDEELIVHIFGLAMISRSEHRFDKDSHNPETMNMQILIDGIEVDPTYGFNRILNIIKYVEEEADTQRKFKNDLMQFIENWEYKSI